MKVYTIWSEWDLGINANIYATYKVAEKALNKALLEDIGMTFEEARLDGLVGIKEQEVIE